MILPPFSAPTGFTSALHPPPGDLGKVVWLLFSQNQLLVSLDKKNLPIHCEYELSRPSLYLGCWNHTHFFTGEVQKEDSPPSWIWSPIRSLHATLGAAEYSMAGRAMQLLYWDRSNKYCGHCGHQTVPRETERCRECTSCGQLAYPKLSMAILALVVRDERILLARSPHFPEPFFSALAGFVDPGETFEQCVMREVFEEVGLKVKNVRYFGSQPWPLSHSIMIGFTCDWAEGEISIDPAEIAEAAWFERTKMPHLPPHLSLSRILIDSFIHKPLTTNSLSLS